jgi:S1-C subfamily serine protease
MNRFVLTLGCGLLVQWSAFAQSSAPAAPAASSGAMARALSQAFADVYEKVSPGVVVIEALEGDDPRLASPLLHLYAPYSPRQRNAVNQGSGFVMTADGYILTNSHVLEGSRPDGVRVTLKDGRKFEAKIVGIDENSDLAVLKINASGLPVVQFGDSDKARVGEFAFALGAPYDLRYTFTYGIISAKGRTELMPTRGNYAEYIQTDASINPGNSGGPLVDIDGRVIGVNTLIYGLDQGLGFAIPINMAKKIAGQLITGGRAVRAWLGIFIGTAEDEPEFAARFPDAPKGIVVKDILDGTPASESELQPWDLITAVDGAPVASARELQKAIFEKQVGDEVQLDVWRNNRTVKMSLRTAEQVDDVQRILNRRAVPQGIPVPQQIPIPVPSQPAPSLGDDEDFLQNTPATPPAPPAPKSPTAGLELRPVTGAAARAMKLQPDDGLLVTSVMPGSAAAEAGVKVGDVITSVASTPVRNRGDFVTALKKGGDAVMLNINRGDEKTYAILKP